MKSKVKEVSVSGHWNKDGVTFYTHNYAMEDGQKIQANHKSELPFDKGAEVEYEVTKTHEKYGDSGKVSKPNDFKGKKYSVAFKEIQRMVRSNAIHAVVSVNDRFGEAVLEGNALSVIEKFTLGDITGDIDKFSEEDSLLTSRLASVNNAAIAAKYKSSPTDNVLDVLMKEANNYYKYITK